MPNVFISYSHDSPEHNDRVLALSNRLRSGGIDGVIDQYEQSPPQGWPNWCLDQIEAADFVLVVCTEAYERRFRRKEVGGKGLGVTWEGSVITQELYDSQCDSQKFIPVILSAADAAHIPVTLKGAQHYEVSTEEGYESLYRRLTNQPAVVAPALGKIQHKRPRPLALLPVLERKEDFRGQAWSVPYSRNPLFTGRRATLQEIEAALKSHGRVALAGLGGVGKTQMAVEYAFNLASKYSLVWWIRAEQLETLAADYASLALVLDPKAKADRSQKELCKVVRHRLSEETSWLLVFDNATGADALGGFLPYGNAGHVIVTSRSPAWSSVGPSISVGTFERGDSVDFLARTTRDKDQDAANDLAGALGDLPLALGQAAAYIERTGQTLSSYLKLFRSRRKDLYKYELPPANYPDTVNTTWTLSTDRAREESPAAFALLNLISYLGPDSIPLGLLKTGAPDLPLILSTAARDDLKLNEAVAALRAYSMVQLYHEALSVHRLVQAVTRDNLSKDEAESWATVAVKVLRSAFPHESEDIKNWGQCSRLLPHALAAVRHAERLKLEGHVSSCLLNQVGLYLRARGEFDEAEAVLKQALDMGDTEYDRIQR